jgi:hypothetical protein
MDEIVEHLAALQPGKKIDALVRASSAGNRKKEEGRGES